MWVFDIKQLEKIKVLFVYSRKCKKDKHSNKDQSTITSGHEVFWGKKIHKENSQKKVKIESWKGWIVESVSAKSADTGA